MNIFVITLLNFQFFTARTGQSSRRFGALSKKAALLSFSFPITLVHMMVWIAEMFPRPKNTVPQGG